MFGPIAFLIFIDEYCVDVRGIDGDGNLLRILERLTLCSFRDTSEKISVFTHLSLKTSLGSVSNKQVPDCVGLISTGEPLHTMIGLGKRANVVLRSTRSLPKARGKVSSRGRSLLSMKSDVSHSGESAAVHHAQTSRSSFSDESGMGDNDPAVARTVKTLSVAGSDMPASRQEKEARSVGGIPSR